MTEETKLAAAEARGAEDTSIVESSKAEDTVEPERAEDGEGIHEAIHDDSTHKGAHEGREKKREEEKPREALLTHRDTPLPPKESEKDKKPQPTYKPTTYVETDHYTIRF